MKQKQFQVVLVCLLMLIFQNCYANQNRVALVIGNSDYKDVPLKNPSNDAADMADKLTELGFKVDKLINANNRKMIQAIQRFGKKLQTKNTVGLFYFAGHGVQIDGSNFLLPIKANIESEADIQFEAVNVARVLRQMEYSGNSLNLVILDACRNNPFARSFRSATRGLAKIGAPKGSKILYATSPGNVAADGSGRNGLFTEMLMKTMDKKGLTIERVFKETAIAVNQASSGKQVPYNEGVILGDFYFTGPITIKNTSPIKVASVNLDEVSKAENLFWDSVESDPSKEMYEAYLNNYSDGLYSDIARIKLYKFKRKSPPKNNTGKLTVRSNVIGDNVILNGEDQGSTRLDLMLKPGRYALEVNKSGYVSWERTIDIKAGSEQVVYAVLNRSIKDTTTGMELMKVPKGCFQMGNNNGTSDEKPIHKVCISKDFYLGKYEVTQGQWKQIMGNNPSYFKKDDNHPVEQVTWNEVQHFIKKLNQQTGHTYRLPTEAEWEYACRSGGKDKKYCGADNLDDLGWYENNSEHRTHSVGGKSPNNLGLYDMSGNVWEWTCSAYNESYDDSEKLCHDGSERYSLRGGSWGSKSGTLHSTNRNGYMPAFRGISIGFRLAQSQEI